MKATLTKTEFKTYLESKTPSAMVGIAAHAEKCPLAKYFQTINEIKPNQVEIDGEVCLHNKDGDVVRTAKFTPWMEKFIQGVDEFGTESESKSDKFGSVRISAKKALDILAKC